MLRKILVVDSFSKQAISKIKDIAKNQNFKLIYEPDIHPSNISKFLLKNCSGIIVKDNKIDEQTLINWRNKYLSSRLCIIKAGADPSNIDLKMALDLQIPIINYPSANSNQISQYILEKIPFDNITKIVSEANVLADNCQLTCFADERDELKLSPNEFLSEMNTTIPALKQTVIEAQVEVMKQNFREQKKQYAKVVHKAIVASKNKDLQVPTRE